MAENSARKIKITLLGTGTSQGVPIIGCDCEVCLSSDPKDQRLRTSVMVSEGERNVVIDTGPDFRQQMLRAGIRRLDGLVITHEHNDHIVGLDDIRPFNFRQRFSMPVYASVRVLEELTARFSYVFAANPYPGAPSVERHPIRKEHPFTVAGIPFIPVEVMHGKMPVLGFRIGDLTYITDAKIIAEEELNKIRGSRVLIINALHHREHHSHLNLKEALAIIEKINPDEAYLTHISHCMGLSREINATLPEGVQLAYDTLELEACLS